MARTTAEPELAALDLEIAPIVEALRAHGVETFSSCQGGEGHAYAEPTVAFHGVYAEGFRALSVAIGLMLPVRALRRVWRVSPHDEPDGPIWEMTFSRVRGWERSASLAPPDLRRRSSDR